MTRKIRSTGLPKRSNRWRLSLPLKEAITSLLEGSMVTRVGFMTMMDGFENGLEQASKEDEESYISAVSHTKLAVRC
jgi:hypothetical protein